MARRDLTGAVDFGHLEGFAAGDEALVEEVLGLFREQAALWLPLLDPAAEAGAWRDAAHSLKGSALGIGAAALAQACSEAEQAKEAGAPEKSLARARIADCLGAVLADIVEYTSR